MEGYLVAILSRFFILNRNEELPYNLVVSERACAVERGVTQQISAVDVWWFLPVELQIIDEKLSK